MRHRVKLDGHKVTNDSDNEETQERAFARRSRSNFLSLFYWSLWPAEFIQPMAITSCHPRASATKSHSTSYHSRTEIGRNRGSPARVLVIAACLFYSLNIIGEANSTKLQLHDGNEENAHRGTGLMFKRESLAEQACAEFSERDPPRSEWRRSECLTVWEAWARTLEDQQYDDYQHRRLFAETAIDLRRKGHPCLMDSQRYADGLGSATIRYLATWMVAEEMGCDWAGPRLPERSIDTTGTSLYCHKMVTSSQLKSAPDQVDMKVPVAGLPQVAGMLRCNLVNSREYFAFMEHAAGSETNGTSHFIRLYVSRPEDLHDALNEYNTLGDRDRPWDHWHFVLGKVEANRFVQSVPSWDSYKREKIRGVLSRFRAAFHHFPRPWYDKKPECMFAQVANGLDFAIHIRFGDRRKYLDDVNSVYFELLEAFMGTVTAAVVDRGYPAPAFHVFSETSRPCPSANNGTFEEFPNWPVEMYQVAPCIYAKTPPDCPEKKAGVIECNPDRSGIFRVAGRQLYLHVGFDVQNDLSCMIQADGILSGCSTFGHVAALLSKGIKFFSVECSGLKTPNHYKMIPPMAVAERGLTWVPVRGSWQDPVIASRRIFEGALDELLQTS